MTRAPRIRPSAFAGAIPLIAGFALLLPALSLAQGPAPLPDIPAAGQASIRDWTDEVPAHISYVEGDTALFRDGAADGSPLGAPLLAGDLLRTRYGRLEVLFADGSALSLDEDTEAELLADNLLRLTRGRIRLDLGRAVGSAGYRVDAGASTTWIRAAGEYRIELRDRNAAPPDVRLFVGYGLAEISANGGQTLVRTGYEAFASVDSTPSRAHAVTVTRWDTFDRWWDARRVAQTTPSNAGYLPPEIASYSNVLESDGDWEYDASYGYVWYPTVVTGWYPYSVGRWSFVGHYGWTWIGHDRWAWPTHHYGRWGHSGRGYYWIPDRHWAPAWVGWTSSPGHIGWSPLGYNNRPIYPAHLGGTTGWRGWTHAPAQRFAARTVVADRGQSRPPDNGRLATDSRGPGRPSTLPVRASTGIRGPGAAARRAVAAPRVAGESATLGTGPGTSQRAGRPPASGSNGAAEPSLGARNRRPLDGNTSTSPRATGAPRQPTAAPGVAAARPNGSRNGTDRTQATEPVSGQAARGERAGNVRTARSRADVIARPPLERRPAPPSESTVSDSSPRSLPRRGTAPVTRAAGAEANEQGPSPSAPAARPTRAQSLPPPRPPARSPGVSAPARSGAERAPARSAPAARGGEARAVPRGRN